MLRRGNINRPREDRIGDFGRQNSAPRGGSEQPKQLAITLEAKTSPKTLQKPIKKSPIDEIDGIDGFDPRRGHRGSRASYLQLTSF